MKAHGIFSLYTIIQWNSRQISDQKGFSRQRRGTMAVYTHTGFNIIGMNRWPRPINPRSCARILFKLLNQTADQFPSASPYLLLMTGSTVVNPVIFTATHPPLASHGFLKVFMVFIGFVLFCFMVCVWWPDPKVSTERRPFLRLDSKTISSLLPA
jgi:hypothetical protein